MIIENKIIYYDRYSSKDEPDKHGRWARQVHFKDLRIAWITRLEYKDEIKFPVTTYFPSNGNDMPTKHKICDNYDEAKKYVEALWDEFINKIL